MTRQTATVPGRAARAAGMTLAEMLVSLGVMSVMMLAFGTILSSSQRVVSASQASIRANSRFAGIAHVIRFDVRRATQSGFLCIARSPGSKSTPQLLLTTVGVSASMTSDTTGLALFAQYGITSNSAAPGNVIWRRGYVLSQDAGPGGGGDTWAGDLADLGVLDRKDMDGIVDDLLANQPSQLNVPAESMDDVQKIWQVLTPYADSLAIEWTDGSTGSASRPLMNWYGVGRGSDNKVTVTAKDGGWKSKTIQTLSPEQFEYNGGGGKYRALWTHHNQSNWPVAVKIGFNLSDESLPKDVQGVKYEVVCAFEGGKKGS